MKVAKRERAWGRKHRAREKTGRMM